MDDAFESSSRSAERTVRRPLLWLLAILAFALMFRVGVACSVQYLLDHRWHRQFLIEGDAEGYWLLAQTIANGETYAVYTPPRYALRMPGFPALLAVSVSLFGDSLFAARLMLSVVGTFACFLAYVLGKRFFGEKVGLVTAALCAVSPTLALFSSVVLAETTFAVAILLSLIAGDQLRQALQREQTKPWQVLGLAVWTGVAIAAGVYCRPSWILVAPIVAVLLLLTSRRGTSVKSAAAGVIVIASMVLALLPWGMRVQKMTGHFTLTTFWMGASLYDGINPHATGDSDMRFFDEDKFWATQSEYDVDQYYKKAAKDYALNNPWHVVQLAWNKALRYWNPLPNAAQFQNPAAAGAVLMFTLPIYVFTIWGISAVLSRSNTAENNLPPLAPLRHVHWRDRFWTVSVLMGPVFYFAAIHMVFVSSLRYRLPAEFSMFVLAAVGIVVAIGLLEKRRRSTK